MTSNAVCNGEQLLKVVLDGAWSDAGSGRREPARKRDERHERGLDLSSHSSERPSPAPRSHTRRPGVPTHFWPQFSMNSASLIFLSRKQ